MNKNFFCLLIVITIMMTGCVTKAEATKTSDVTQRNEPTVSATTPKPLESSTPTTPLTQQESSIIFGYTHQRPDGNRYIEGQSNLQEARIIDIPLDGIPEWVVAVPYADISLWAVVLDNGNAQAFKVDASGAESVQITPDQLKPDSIPLLRVEGNLPSFVTVPFDDQSSLTHPIEIPELSLHAHIQEDGSLILSSSPDTVVASLPVQALPDARILRDESNHLILLTNPTDSYDHGILGDPLEATSVTVIELSPESKIVSNFPVPDGQVIEGIAPIWTDWNGDGEREIIVTLSNAIQGAQLAVFNAEGQMIGSSSTIGLGYRWRHQIAVAPFGPNGEWELVDVLTPHIGGIVEFFQWQGEQLEKIAEVSGYTSHVIRTRNLDMAAAADFDGDGRIELLLPNQSLTELGAIQRTEQGAEVTWSLPVDGKIKTNLGAVSLENNFIAVGVGRTDGILRIWYPDIP